MSDDQSAVDAEFVRTIEREIEKTLYEVEQRGEFPAALDDYQALVARMANKPPTPILARLHAHIYMRLANVLTELDRIEEALHYAASSLEMARQSQDDITTARAHLGLGAALLTQQRQEGLQHLHQAADIFAAGDSPDHREGLGWVHILHADLRSLGLIPSKPQEIVARSEQALAYLRPLEIWPGIDRAHAVRGAAWDQYGWESIWRHFEVEASLTDGRKESAAWANNGFRNATFLIRIPAVPLQERLRHLREALAPFSPYISLLPETALHIPLQTILAEGTGTRALTSTELASLRRATAERLTDVGPISVALGNLNAFADRLVLEVHDPSGQLWAVRDRIRAAAGLPPQPTRELIPHLPLAVAIATTAAPTALRNALMSFRDWPVATLDVNAIELALVDLNNAALPLELVAVLPFGE